MSAQTRLALWTLLAAAAAAPVLAAAGEENFGRWEAPLRRCQLSWPREPLRPAQSSGCLSVRLDQSIEGLLRVRFINAAGNSRYASEELAFVGLLLQQDKPMQCHQGHCQPRWPLRLVVQGVASRRFDERGVAAQLPRNQLAKGSCRLSATSLWCDAKGAEGQRWSANAQLRQLAVTPDSPTNGRQER